MSRGSKVKAAMTTAVAVALGLGAFMGASAASKAPKAAAAGPFSSAKALMAKGNFKKACEEMENILKTNSSPQAQFLAGEAYFKAGDLKKSRKHLRTVVRTGRGSIYAKQANAILMKMPVDMTRPRTGPETRMLASLFGLARTRGAGDEPHPTVIDFYASWCQPCKDMDKALDKVKTQYGEKITIMKVDIDDPKNDKIIDQYEVSPIPTVVFLNSEGEVVTYTIGYAENNVTDGIKKILD